MENNKFFRTIWRFNSLVISAAGVLAIAVLLFVSYKLYKDVTRERNTQNIVNLEESPEVRENWRLGQLSEVVDGQVFMVPLYSDQTFSREYFSKSSNSVRNYLFIDAKSHERRWLFKHTDYLIESNSKLRLGDYDSRKPVQAIIYELVKIDSNHDSRLTPKDLITVAITKPDGSEYKEIISEVNQVIDWKLLSKKSLLIIFQKDQVTYSGILDLNSKKLENISQIPSVGL